MFNNAPKKLILYFSNTLVKSDTNCEIDKATIEALTDVQTYNLYCFDYLPIPETDGENFEGEGGILTENLKLIDYYEIETGYFDLATEFSNYQSFKTLYNSYRNKYLFEPVTEYGTAIHTTNKVIAVTTTEIETTIEGGLIGLTLKFRKRK